MYTFVPLTSLILLTFLAICPSLFWRSTPESPSRHAPYFPPPIPQIILSAALWSFGYLLRVPTYAVVSFILRQLHPMFTTLIFNAIYVTIYNLLRISSLPILRVRERMKYRHPSCHDGIFLTVWWLAIGWAAIDVAVSIIQSYVHIALYKNVMVPEEQAADILAQGDETPQLLSASQEILPLSPRQESPKDSQDESGPNSVQEAIRLAVDQDLEQLVNLKEREDVEEIYGVPIIVRHCGCVSTTMLIYLTENTSVRVLPATNSRYPPFCWYYPNTLRRLPQIKPFQANSQWIFDSLYYLRQPFLCYHISTDLAA